MSLKNALETAKEILAQHSEDQLDETYMEAEEMKKKKGTKAGGEDKDVSVDAEGHGEKSADGVTPKAIEPLEGGQLGKADSGKEVVGDLKDKEEEEYGEGEEAEEMEDEMMGMEDEEMDDDDDDDEDEEAEEGLKTLKKMTPGIKEHLGKLFSGEELSEEFKSKASTIFESAVDMKVDEVRAELHEEFEAKLEVQKEELASKLDEYLSYVVENWMKENQVAIDAGIRTDVTESFMVGLKKLFEDHYVTMPEESYDLVEGLNNKVDDLEGKLNEQIEKSIELSKGLIKAQCEAMYESHARDLTTSDEEKFRTMVEKLDFDGVDDFQDKLVTLKENFFDEDTPVKTPLVEEVAVSEEEAMKESVELTPTMSAYTNMLNRINTSDKNKVR
jgi:hypothetical protein|tara:strand:- start:420 stop:1580 length:1161 start_codon:yes stop_codon:yes gene_type:complete